VEIIDIGSLPVVMSSAGGGGDSQVCGDHRRGGVGSGGGSADGARSGEAGSPRCSADARRGSLFNPFFFFLVRVFAGWLWWVGGSEVRAALRLDGVGSGGESAGGARGGKAGVEARKILDIGGVPFVMSSSGGWWSARCGRWGVRAAARGSLSWVVAGAS
jgi:hypothetical protein